LDYILEYGRPGVLAKISMLAELQRHGIGRRLVQYVLDLHPDITEWTHTAPSEDGKPFWIAMRAAHPTIKYDKE
jgi:GNAT superfamily N-acetyltransferase